MTTHATGQPIDHRPRSAASATRCKRHEDDRFIEGQGNFLDDHVLPGMLHMAILRSPVAARAHQEHRHVGRDRARRRRRRRHRRAARAVRPRVDADDVGRHPGRARHRQGAVPGPGGRGGRRDRPLHRRGRARAHRRRLRGPARRSRRRSRRSPTARCSSATTRRARPTTSSTSGSRGDAAATEAAFAKADRVVTLETHYPRSHPAPLETCGVLADVNSVTGQATIYMTSQAPHAHRTRVRDGRRPARAEHPRSSAPTSAAASATRCRCTRATWSRPRRRS